MIMIICISQKSSSLWGTAFFPNQEAENFSHLVSGESGSLQENIPHDPFQHENQQRQLPVTSVYTVVHYNTN